MKERDLELDKALDIQNKAFEAINNTMKTLAATEVNTFPNYPLMIPTLYLAAMCHYINGYINSFPDNAKPSMVLMAYKAIGFTEDEAHDLATMPVAGNA